MLTKPRPVMIARWMMMCRKDLGYFYREPPAMSCLVVDNIMYYFVAQVTERTLARLCLMGARGNSDPVKPSHSSPFYGFCREHVSRNSSISLTFF